MKPTGRTWKVVIALQGQIALPRKQLKHPLFFWFLTADEICVAVILLWLALYDFYHRFSS
jgi:hypothetical protein